MSHPTPDQLSAHLDGALHHAAFDLVRRHLVWCEPCRVRCLGMALVDEVVADLLTHDADDQFFAVLEGFLADQFDAKAVSGAIPPALEHLLATEIARVEAHRRAAVGQLAGAIGGAAEAPPPKVRPGAAPPSRPAAPAAPSWEPRRRRRVRVGEIPDFTTAKPVAASSSRAMRPFAPDRWSAPRPTMAPPSRRAEASPRPDWAQRILGTAVVGLAFLLVGLYLGSVGQRRWARDARVPAEARVARVEPLVAPAASPQGPERADSPVEGSAAPPHPDTLAAKIGGPRETVAAPSPSAPAAEAVAPRSSAPAPVATEVAILCGRVRDESGVPVAGAQVLLADLKVGALTDPHGRFCISAPAGPRTVSVTAPGFTTQRHLVTMGRRTPELAFVLTTKGARQSADAGNP